MKRLLTFAAVVMFAPVIFVAAVFLYAVCELQPLTPLEDEE